MSGRVTTAFVSLKSRCVKQWCEDAVRRRLNVCDIFCISEKKMERKMLVRGGALGQPHSGIRIEASLGKYVFGVFETTSATCGELRQNRLSYSPRRGSVPYRMFTTYFASVTKRMERAVHNEVPGSSPTLGPKCLRHILHQ